MIKPFDFVNDILVGKKNLIKDAATEKDYVPFVINRGLSYHKDCIMQANMMNARHQIDKKLQNDFLLNTIRSFKRPYNKWVKALKNEDIESVALFFDMSKRKAADIMRLLSVDDIKEIKIKTDIGG